MSDQKLRVTGGTTLQNIQQFIQDNHGEKKQLFAKTEGGQTVLYLKRHAGLSNMLHGKTATKQDAAREIVRNATATSLTAANQTGNVAMGESLRVVTRAVTGKFGEGGGELRARDVSRIAASVATITSRVAAIPMPPAASGPAFDRPAVNLTALGPTFATGQAMTAARNALAGMDQTTPDTQREAAADALGTAIATLYSASHGATDRNAFALSTGETLKAELAHALGQGGDGKVTTAVIARAFDIAATKVGADRAGDPAQGNQITDSKGNTHQQPDITLNNRRYRLEGYLGEGGFGTVYRYREVLPNTQAQGGQATAPQTPHEIAVKIQLPVEADVGDGTNTNPDAAKIAAQRNCEMLNEFQQHRAALGTGSPYVMGDPGALRMPDGSIALTSEILPHGNIYEFSGALAAAVGQPDQNGQLPAGKISAQDAKLIALRLTKDMALGLAHMNGTQGLTHYDFKGPNCIIGADGRAKIADMGTVTSNARLQFANLPSVDNPTWKAPERLYAAKEVKHLKRLEENQHAAKTHEYKQELAAAFRNAGVPENTSMAAFLDQFTSRIVNPTLPSGRLQEQVTVDSSVDVWALGITAHKLITGTDFMPDMGFLSAIETKLEAWGTSWNVDAIDANTPVGSEPSNLQLLSTTGDTNVDALFNRILHRNPGNRPDGATIAGDAVFARPGMESNQLRNLITAIASGNAQQIDQARAALSQMLAPTVPANPGPATAQATTSTAQSTTATSPAPSVTASPPSQPGPSPLPSVNPNAGRPLPQPPQRASS